MMERHQREAEEQRIYPTNPLRHRLNCYFLMMSRRYSCCFRCLYSSRKLSILRQNHLSQPSYRDLW